MPRGGRGRKRRGGTRWSRPTKRYDWEKLAKATPKVRAPSPPGEVSEIGDDDHKESDSGDLIMDVDEDATTDCDSEQFDMDTEAGCSFDKDSDSVVTEPIIPEPIVVPETNKSSEPIQEPVVVLETNIQDSNVTQSIIQEPVVVPQLNIQDSDVVIDEPNVQDSVVVVKDEPNVLDSLVVIDEPKVQDSVVMIDEPNVQDSVLSEPFVQEPIVVPQLNIQNSVGVVLISEPIGQDSVVVIGELILQDSVVTEPFIQEPIVVPQLNIQDSSMVIDEPVVVTELNIQETPTPPCTVTEAMEGLREHLISIPTIGKMKGMIFVRKLWMTFESYYLVLVNSNDPSKPSLRREMFEKEADRISDVATVSALLDLIDDMESGKSFNQLLSQNENDAQAIANLNEGLQDLKLVSEICKEYFEETKKFLKSKNGNQNIEDMPGLTATA